MISLEEALGKIQEAVKPLGENETVPLAQAVGRVLASPVLASLDQPPFTNSAVDGFAIKSRESEKASELTPLFLSLVGFQRAGSPFVTLPAQSAFEIATGAPLPHGADAVVMREESEFDENYLLLKAPVVAGKNVRPQGENVRAGTQLLAAGERIFEKHIGLLASFGLEHFLVTRSPRVSYLATGDEVIEVGKERLAHQIYNSNALCLRTLFEKEGCFFSDFGVRRDCIIELADWVAQEKRNAFDLLVLTGGVSVGRADHVKGVLERAGAQIIFHKVAIKPGKPILFALLDGKPVFGLPGNPLSVQVGFYQFVLPAIQCLLGEKGRERKKMQAFLEREIARDTKHLILVGRAQSNEGKMWVLPLKQGSGNVALFSDGNCFISIPPGEERLERGTLVEIEPYD